MVHDLRQADQAELVRLVIDVLRVLRPYGIVIADPNGISGPTPQPETSTPQGPAPVTGSPDLLTDEQAEPRYVPAAAPPGDAGLVEVNGEPAGVTP
jgi:predicted O-methyltransferase YrrM